MCLCVWGGRGSSLKLDIQGQGGVKGLHVDGRVGEGGGGSSKLDNFHGRLICIFSRYGFRSDYPERF